jgi:uncharacterized protein YjbJ (UPF0337 family)
VSDEEKPQVTREGLFGELFGMAKEKAGELLGNDHLMAEGQLQQAIAEAEAVGLAAKGAHPEEEHTGEEPSAEEPSAEEHALEEHTAEDRLAEDRLAEERPTGEAHPDE